MIPAFPVIPLVNGHVTVRASTVLAQLLMPQRMTHLAAGNEITAVDEAGTLAAESAPWRFPAAVNPGIRTVALKVPLVAAAPACQVFYSSHLFPAFAFRALLQLPLKPTFSYLTR